MKSVSRLSMPRAVLSTFALAAALALFAAQATALASTGPAVGPNAQQNAQIAAPPAVPTNLTATRYGQKVHLAWTWHGNKNVYVFHAVAASAPPNDFLKGPWQNPAIVEYSQTQIDLTIAPAAKPQHDYYLLCIAGVGSAYYCGSVAAERPAMTVPAPVLLPH